jgi:hypothetical protein
MKEEGKEQERIMTPVLPSCFCASCAFVPLCG